MSTLLYTITSVNGTDLLFQVPTPFDPTTLRVIERDTLDQETVVDVETLGTNFFKIDPPPQIGSDLICYFDPIDEDPIGTDSLSQWEKSNIERIMSTIAYQGQTIKNLQEAIENRLTHEVFNSYSEIIEKEIKDMKVSIINS